MKALHTRIRNTHSLCPVTDNRLLGMPVCCTCIPVSTASSRRKRRIWHTNLPCIFVTKDLLQCSPVLALLKGVRILDSCNDTVLPLRLWDKSHGG